MADRTDPATLADAIADADVGQGERRPLPQDAVAEAAQDSVKMEDGPVRGASAGSSDREAD